MNFLVSLKTRSDYVNAIERIIEIFGEKPGDANFEELIYLGKLIEDYENQKYPIPPKKVI